MCWFFYCISPKWFILSYFHGCDPSTGHPVWKIGLLSGTPWLQFTAPIHVVWPHQHLITFLNLGFDCITHIFSKPSNISLHYSIQYTSYTWNFSNRCPHPCFSAFYPLMYDLPLESNCTNGLLNSHSALLASLTQFMPSAVSGLLLPYCY